MAGCDPQAVPWGGAERRVAPPAPPQGCLKISYAQIQSTTLAPFLVSLS